MRWWTAVAVLLFAGCTTDDPEPDPVLPVPQAGFCEKVVAAAGQDWVVDEQISGDADDITATCGLGSDGTRVDLVVRVTEGAADQYEQTESELADGFTGFRDPTTTAIDGWWKEGRRYQAASNDATRLTDLLLGDTVFVRLQLIGATGDEQNDDATLADELDAAVAEVLGV